MLTVKDIANKIGCCDNFVRVNICRVDFSHIKVYKIGRNLSFDNVLDDDIRELRRLYKNARKKLHH